MVFVERSFSVFRLFSDSFWSNSPTVCLSCILFNFNYFPRCACRHVRGGCELRTTACPQCLPRFPRLLIFLRGFTPAPTVTTPASLPSQPVSLPENNALTQAISRALAESPPLLLSALRDSSGGNTNMAATAGPLSSASTSTPPPVLAALPLSLQVHLLCPPLFQPTAHLAVLQSSLLFPPHPSPTCL